MAFTITNGLCELSDVKSALNINDTNDDDRISLAIDASSRLIEAACDRRFYQDPLPRTDGGCVLDATDPTGTVLDTSITALDAGRSVIDPTENNYIQPMTIVGQVVPGVSFTLVNFEGAILPPTGSGTQELTIGLTPRRYVSNDPWLVEVDDISTQWGLIVRSDYAGDGTFGTEWEVQDYQLEPINGIMEGQPNWPFSKIRAVRSLSSQCGWNRLSQAVHPGLGGSHGAVGMAIHSISRHAGGDHPVDLDLQSPRRPIWCDSIWRRRSHPSQRGAASDSREVVTGLSR